MVSGQRHETTQRRSATAIHIPVALCDAPGVKTKILSTKKGPGCKHRSRSHGESGEVFLLDTLSHRMSETAILRQSTCGGGQFFEICAGGSARKAACGKLRT